MQLKWQQCFDLWHCYCDLIINSSCINNEDQEHGQQCLKNKTWWWNSLELLKLSRNGDLLQGWQKRDHHQRHWWDQVRLPQACLRPVSGCNHGGFQHQGQHQCTERENFDDRMMWQGWYHVSKWISKCGHGSAISAPMMHTLVDTLQRSSTLCQKASFINISFLPITWATI